MSLHHKNCTIDQHITDKARKSIADCLLTCVNNMSLTACHCQGLTLTARQRQATK